MQKNITKQTYTIVNVLAGKASFILARIFGDKRGRGF